MNILLTGASRGIGKAAADALTAAGHTVLGTSTCGGEALIAADFADPAVAARCWSEAVERLGRVDVLVNNAGVYEAVSDTAEEGEWQASWARTMQVNLQAAADLTRFAIGHFREHGGGRLVNVASRGGDRRGIDNIRTYGAAP